MCRKVHMFEWYTKFKEWQTSVLADYRQGGPNIRRELEVDVDSSPLLMFSDRCQTVRKTADQVRELCDNLTVDGIVTRTTCGFVERRSVCDLVEAMLKSVKTNINSNNF